MNQCALLTAAGRGAVAVIAARGPQLESILDDAFTPIGSRQFSDLGHKHIVYGVWNATGEDLVVVRTGTESIEIQCHGGNAAAPAILDDLQARNCTAISALQWQTNQTGQWHAQTQLAISQATTLKTALCLQAVENRLQEFLTDLTNSIREEDADSAMLKIDRALAWSDFGLSLTVPRSVVLCGQPNVGKSSLINAIVGFERAIVNPRAGTTRDVVSQLTAINGWPVSLRDTAGLRVSADAIEALGIGKAKQEMEAADVCVAVFDASQPWSNDDQESLTLISSIQRKLLLAFNKSDLPVSQGQGNHQSRPQGLSISAVTGAGMEELIGEIAGLLVSESPSGEVWFPVSRWQIDCLKSIQADIQRSAFADAIKKIQL